MQGVAGNALRLLWWAGLFVMNSEEEGKRERTRLDAIRNLMRMLKERKQRRKR
jgi:hypothetical protein